MRGQEAGAAGEAAAAAGFSCTTLARDGSKTALARDMEEEGAAGMSMDFLV